MNEKAKTAAKGALYGVFLAVSCVAFLLFVLFGCFSMATLFDGKVYETREISEYLNVTGNYDNESPREFAESFFPKTIEEQFQDVSYHYKAMTGDTYAYEMSLEFTVKSDADYQSILSRYTEGRSGAEFEYDSRFTEYVIADEFSIVDGGPEESYKLVSDDGTEYVHISGAEIGRILCCEEERRFLFVALGVYDGGYTSTLVLNDYFSRFGIEPWEHYKDQQTHLKEPWDVG
ncbi:MAG: hypothetical protein IJF33_08160 [Clostridia bacterium]|nr:hypothetical protein [Clostridia bacterium]